MADEAKTTLPNEPNYVQRLLLQNKYWIMGARRNMVPIETLDAGHLRNVVAWLDNQCEYIVGMFGISTTDIDHEAMVRWLHQQPLLKALDAAIVHQQHLAREKPAEGLEPSGWMLGMMGSVDTDTTGVDVENDRLVRFIYGIAREPGDWQSVVKLVNPGVDIPLEATMIHGLSTGQVIEDGIDPVPALSAIHMILSEFANRDIPVVLHNAKFHLSLLDRESRRHLDRPLVVGPVLDTLLLDRIIDKFRKGKRNLAVLCEYYGVGVLINHSADEDALRALRLAWRILTSARAKEHFTELPSLDDLQDLQREAFMENEERMAAWIAKQGGYPGEVDLAWPIKEYHG